MADGWKKIEELLRGALSEIPDTLYASELDDGMTVGEVVEEVLGYLEHNELGLAHEALEDIGIEFDISEAFRNHMAQAAELMSM